MLGVRPSFATGFAQHAGESKYPELWQGLVGLWAPGLGPTGSRLFDFSKNSNTGVITNAVWQDQEGTELVTDGVFATWADFADPDNEPSNWTSTITGGAVEPTRKFVDATNACQMITEGNHIGITQGILTVGKTYSYSINIATIVSGGIIIQWDVGEKDSFTTTGVKTGTFTAGRADFEIRRRVSEATNVTFTDVSVKEIRPGSPSALLYNGTDSKVTIPAHPSIDASGKTGLSIVALINPASDGENDTARIVDKANSIAAISAGYRLFVNQEAGGLVGLRFSVATNTTDMVAEVAPAVPINIWSLIVATYNEDIAQKGKIYMGGALQALEVDTAGNDALSDDSAVDLTIGNATEAISRTFDGKIGIVMIYDRALKGVEVAFLSQNPYGLFEKFEI